MATVDRFELPDDLYYDRAEHAWVRAEAEGLRIGLDALGLDALGDVVHLTLVPEGTAVRRGEALGSIEAEKMVRPLLAPVSGTVIARNAGILETPRRMASDPYGSGWLILIQPTDWPAEAAELVQGPAVADWAREEIASYSENPPHPPLSHPGRGTKKDALSHPGMG
jgi:glycine cleavage system H protein